MDNVITEAQDLKDLRPLVAHQGADAHLGHDLEDAHAHRVDVLLHNVITAHARGQLAILYTQHRTARRDAVTEGGGYTGSTAYSTRPTSCKSNRTAHAPPATGQDSSTAHASARIRMCAKHAFTHTCCSAAPAPLPHINTRMRTHLLQGEQRLIGEIGADGISSVTQGNAELVHLTRLTRLQDEAWGGGWGGGIRGRQSGLMR